MYGHAGVDPNLNMNQQNGNPFGGGGNPFGFNFNDGSFHFSSSNMSSRNGEIDAEELFEAFFGAGARQSQHQHNYNYQRGPRRGADLQMHVRLTFMEAVLGTTKDLNLRYQIQSKSKSKSKSKSNQMEMEMEMEMEIKERTVEVTIPAGIESGMSLRLAGQGAEGDPGASRGNLLVQVIVEEHDYFQRDGYDVHTDVPISITQAILGGTVDVQTLTGKVVEVKIPKGCQVHTKLLLRGKGIPFLNQSHQKGSHIVHLKIQIPKTITERQEHLLREFDHETEQCGSGGISGRLAKAAGSAFESFFSSSRNKENQGKNEDDDNNKNEDDNNHNNNNENDKDMEGEDKKQQASN